jgi:hypothetical protein
MIVTIMVLELLSGIRSHAGYGAGTDRSQSSRSSHANPGGVVAPRLGFGLIAWR